MAFSKTYGIFSDVETLRGDTLQKIAQRELGDASRWVELAVVNNLTFPYITDDPSQSNINVLLSGAVIRVPTQRQLASATSDPDHVFGSDVKLERGELSTVNGDLALVSGVSNLSQALHHVIETEPGELLFHPKYGCSVRSFQGEKNIQQGARFAIALVKRSLMEDPRISKVNNALVVVQGDALMIEADAIAVNGKQVSTKVNYGIPG